jgi:hypothetical protein
MRSRPEIGASMDVLMAQPGSGLVVLPDGFAHHISFGGKRHEHC